jgi:hypothetical protein
MLALVSSSVIKKQVDFLIHAWDKGEDPVHPFTYQDLLQPEKIARAYALIAYLVHILYNLNII